MNFKDLQFSIGKLKADVHSQLAKNNPLQKQDTKALSLWIFQERNDLASMRTVAYERSETIKALKGWVKEQVEEEKIENSRDLEDLVGDKLCRLLEKQIEIEQQYAVKYQQYRHAIKSIRDREEKLSDQREKKRSLQSRIANLNKTNSKSPKLIEFQRELNSLNQDTHESEMEFADFKRFALKEAFYLRFNAMNEYAEKTALIAGFGKYLTDLLDIQPTKTPTRKPYDKGSDAAMIFADAMNAVQQWKPSLEDERPTLVNQVLPSEDKKGKSPEAPKTNNPPPSLPPRPQDNSPTSPQLSKPTGYSTQEISSVTSDHKISTPETQIDVSRINLYDAPPPAYDYQYDTLNAEMKQRPNQHPSFNSPYQVHQAPVSPYPTHVHITDSPRPMHNNSVYDDQQQAIYSQMDYSQLYNQFTQQQQNHQHRPYSEFQQEQQQRIDAGGFRIPHQQPISAEDEKEKLAQYYQQLEQQHLQQQQQQQQHSYHDPQQQYYYDPNQQQYYHDPHQQQYYQDSNQQQQHYQNQSLHAASSPSAQHPQYYQSQVNNQQGSYYTAQVPHTPSSPRMQQQGYYQPQVTQSNTSSPHIQHQAQSNASSPYVQSNTSTPYVQHHPPHQHDEKSEAN